MGNITWRISKIYCPCRVSKICRILLNPVTPELCSRFEGYFWKSKRRRMTLGSQSQKSIIHSMTGSQSPNTIIHSMTGSQYQKLIIHSITLGSQSQKSIIHSMTLGSQSQNRFFLVYTAPLANFFGYRAPQAILFVERRWRFFVVGAAPRHWVGLSRSYFGGKLRRRFFLGL